MFWFLLLTLILANNRRPRHAIPKLVERTTLSLIRSDLEKSDVPFEHESNGLAAAIMTQRAVSFQTMLVWEGRSFIASLRRSSTLCRNNGVHRSVRVKEKNFGANFHKTPVRRREFDSSKKSNIAADLFSTEFPEPTYTSIRKLIWAMVSIAILVYSCVD